MRALRVSWEATKDLWEELLLLVLMNLLTTVLMIPVLTFPPAMAGLWNAANLVAEGRTIAWSDYFEGFRRYFWKAWGLALLNILVAVIVLTNVRFYTPGISPFDINPTLSVWIRAVFVAVGILWLVAQMYPMALLLEQDDQRLRVALRNTAAVFILNPGFTIILALLLGVITFISMLIPVLWFLVTLAFFAVVCNKAVLHMLELYRSREEEKKEKEGEKDERGEEEKEDGGSTD